MLTKAYPDIPVCEENWLQVPLLGLYTVLNEIWDFCHNLIPSQEEPLPTLRDQCDLQMNHRSQYKRDFKLFFSAIWPDHELKNWLNKWWIPGRKFKVIFHIDLAKKPTFFNTEKRNLN